MKIFVTVKQVPDTSGKVAVNPELRASPQSWASTAPTRCMCMTPPC